MDILKILGLGLIAAVFSVFIKNTRPEFSLLLSIITSVTLILFIMPHFKQIVVELKDISEILGVDNKYFVPVFKVIGIAYITQIGGDLCRDSGENAIATKIELAGKIAIVIITIPVAYKMISVINGIIFSV